MIEALKKIRFSSLLIPAGLWLLTLYLFLPVVHFEFLSFDDDLFVSKNPFLQNGMTWDSIQWAFCADLTFLTKHADFWQPVTFLSHLLDVELWGMNAGAHHFSNILYHSFNVLLVHALIRRFGFSIGYALMGATIFSFHPLQVETVTWIVARKHLLGAFWALASVHMYLSYAREKKNAFYLLSLLFFLLSLLSKPNAIVLPGILFFLDFCSLGRWGIVSFKKIFFEKIPYAIFSLLSAATPILPFWALEKGVRKDVAYAAHDVILTNVSAAPFIQLGKFFLLRPLGMNRSVSLNTQADLTMMLLHFALLLATLWLAFCFHRKQKKMLTLGWCWFLLFLIPTLSLRWTADRFMYLPIIGLIVFFMSVMRDMNLTFKMKPIYPILLSVVILFSLGLVTRVYLKDWRNDFTFFNAGLKRNPDSYIFRSSLGTAYANAGYPYDAMLHFDLALKIQDTDPVLYNNYGVVLEALGRFEEANEMYKKALALFPEYHSAKENTVRLKAELDRLISKGVN